MDQTDDIIWISFVFVEVILDTKSEPISLTNSLSKADVSKYKVFFKKIIQVY
jgi:hypothetical protein